MFPFAVLQRCWATCDIEVLSCAVPQPPAASEQMGGVSPGWARRSLLSPVLGSPELEALLQAQPYQCGAGGRITFPDLCPCWGQEQRYPLARAGALLSPCLTSTFQTTVPPSTAAPGDLTCDSALAVRAAAPFMGAEGLGPHLGTSQPPL